MKVTEKTRKIVTIVAEEGDTLQDLWEAVGGSPGGGWPVKIEGGAIVAVQPEYIF